MKKVCPFISRPIVFKTSTTGKNETGLERIKCLENECEAWSERLEHCLLIPFVNEDDVGMFK